MFKNKFNPEPEDRLPNGRTRQEYYDAGISDSEIEFWGLDQPGAPGSQATGFVIMDLINGDWDGEVGNEIVLRPRN